MPIDCNVGERSRRVGPPTTPGPHAPADTCVKPLRAISAPLPEGSSQTRSHGPNEDLETPALRRAP